MKPKVTDYLLALTIILLAGCDKTEPTYHEIIKDRNGIEVPLVPHAAYYDFNTWGLFAVAKKDELKFFSRNSDGLFDLENIHDISIEHPLFVYANATADWTVLRTLLSELKKSERTEIFVTCEEGDVDYLEGDYPLHICASAAPDTVPESSISFQFMKDGSVVQRDATHIFTHKSDLELPNHINWTHKKNPEAYFLISGESGLSVEDFIFKYHKLRIYVESNDCLFRIVIDSEAELLGTAYMNTEANQALQPTPLDAIDEVKAQAGALSASAIRSAGKEQL